MSPLPQQRWDRLTVVVSGVEDQALGDVLDVLSGLVACYDFAYAAQKHSLPYEPTRGPEEGAAFESWAFWSRQKLRELVHQDAAAVRLQSFKTGSIELVIGGTAGAIGIIASVVHICNMIATGSSQRMDNHAKAKALFESLVASGQLPSGARRHVAALYPPAARMLRALERNLSVRVKEPK